MDVGVWNFAVHSDMSNWTKNGKTKIGIPRHPYPLKQIWDVIFLSLKNKKKVSYSKLLEMARKSFLDPNQKEGRKRKQFGSKMK